MTCAPAAPPLDICPTQGQITPQLLLLLPRGRAFNTHDGPPQPGTTIWSFWNAVAPVWAWVNARICALKAEFFCATCSETRDLWMAEYGLPDGCDPYPDLCAKVAAVGGATCAYYQAMAARAGWSIACQAFPAGCGALMGSALMGAAMMGGGGARVELLIVVSLSGSPAYGGSYQTPPLMGRMLMGMPLACAPDISPVQCLLARICRAHCNVLYETVP